MEQNFLGAYPGLPTPIYEDARSVYNIGFVAGHIALEKMAERAGKNLDGITTGDVGTYFTYAQSQLKPNTRHADWVKEQEKRLEKQAPWLFDYYGFVLEEIKANPFSTLHTTAFSDALLGMIDFGLFYLRQS